MNLLELHLKGSKKHKCVKYSNGRVQKVLEYKAYTDVTNGLATYITKTEYKNVMKNGNVAEENVVEVQAEKKVEKKARAKKTKKS